MTKEELRGCIAGLESELLAAKRELRELLIAETGLQVGDIVEYEWACKTLRGAIKRFYVGSNSFGIYVAPLTASGKPHATHEHWPINFAKVQP